MSAGPDIASLARLFDALDATWPPVTQQACGPFELRDGGGGGARVSATVLRGAFDAEALDAAEVLTPARLFQLRGGQETLDKALKARGYRIKDPTVIYAAPVAEIAQKPRPVSLLAAWPPLAMQRQVWADGDIGEARVAVMERACDPKQGFIARYHNRVAGAAFAAIHDEIAMMHALLVETGFRQQGVARYMVRGMAHWAQEQGARVFALAVTEENTAARNLYRALGMIEAGRYHYRERAT
ncbi:GNAT family N-acetyltransferase [Pararhodobacter oceanensis]|uniref:GNAT family N-acetyltransferase n=1 Tax=Pararhodobacter oceanensis TaxID=2172121 RepID=UPI003A90991E